MKDIISKSICVHDGIFHADEVVACGLLLFFQCIEKDKIHRSRKKEILDKCEFVCDVGGIFDLEKKRFDHHQADYRGELSSAGMVLQYLKKIKIIDEDLYQHYYLSLIKGIDEDDNGIISCKEGTCSFSDVIANFLPVYYGASSKDQDGCFSDALDFAYGHLKRMYERYVNVKKDREKVKQAMEKYSKIIIFDEPVAWMDNFFALQGENHPALFVIMPIKNHWKLRGIPPSLSRKMEVRMPLPQKWAGLHEKELADVSKIEGGIFCHKGRFISIWETKEDALKAANIVLNEKRKK